MDIDKEYYMERFGFKCDCCGKVVTKPEELNIKKSIHELERYPEHGDPIYTRYYGVCTDCEGSGILL